MTKKVYQINLAGPDQQFSAAHMTIRSDGSKEAMHGHTYVLKVSVGLNDKDPNEFVPFEYVSELIRKICREWDEKFLLPRKSIYLEMKFETKEEVEFLLCQKRYVLPADEVIFLPIENITVEGLSSETCRRFVASFDPKILLRRVVDIEVNLEEILGCSVTYFWHPSEPHPANSQ